MNLDPVSFQVPGRVEGVEALLADDPVRLVLVDPLPVDLEVHAAREGLFARLAQLADVVIIFYFSL